MLFKRLHIFIGLLTISAFLLTGLYMRLNFPDAYHQNEVARMMFRANHVYLLFSGLLNLGIGVFFIAAVKPIGRRCQFWASVLLLTAPVLLGLAFWAETGDGSFERPLTFLGIVAAISGVGLLSIVQWRELR